MLIATLMPLLSRYSLGFDLVARDDRNTHFVLYEYTKSARPPSRELPAAELKPCVYKKR